ncbi:hypothetical protein R3I93_020030 [Phoxinus phoxinus]|uniref:Ig-like domain-containing protein n=1 Tax=Phoxinus phoxinus TaxID=58324 RepID=A0AAN9C919_9TELE
MESMHVSLILIGLSVLCPRTGALDEHQLEEPVLYGPSVALEGSTVEFYCEIPGRPAGSLPLLYELYMESNPGRMIGEHSSLFGEIGTIPLVINTQHDGRLVCKASGHNNTDIRSSLSQGLDLKVIVPVANVSIISDPAGDDVWEGQTLTLRCEKSKGTYVSYEWLWNERPYGTTDDTLIIHRLSALNSGDYMCVASNQFNDTTTFNSSSAVISVKVKESVGGAVTVTPVTHTGRDFQVVGLVLRCAVERGSFPHYRWFLNSTRLEGRGGFYAVAWSDGSVLSLSVGPDSAGFYHCEASDSFDSRTSVRSANMLINEEVLNRVSPAAALVVLGCFALLSAAVMSCCVYGVVLRRRYSGKNLLIEQRRRMEIAVKHEDEEEDDNYPTLESYEEDAVLADKMSDSAEEDDGSVDETLLCEDAVSK